MKEQKTAVKFQNVHIDKLASCKWIYEAVVCTTPGLTR